MQRITSFAVGTFSLLALLLFSALSASPALAQEAKVKAKADEVIDIKSRANDFRVLTSEAGHFYVVPKSWDMNELIFFGDGKTMYQQTMIGGGTRDGDMDFAVWSPRAVGLRQGMLSVKLDGSGAAQCNVKESTKLVPASPAEATRVLTKAVFKAPLWKRRAKFLARDDSGIYFFVDVLRDTEKGHRVYVGSKGQMKLMPMTTLVDDAAGQIYGTKRGELRIVANQGEKATWRKGKKVEPLVVLDPQDNRYLIYRELGIYGQLGTMCDDE